MASTTATRLATAAAAAPTATDWTLANHRAHDRIIRLQEQRAREASGGRRSTATSRLGSFLAGPSPSSRPAFRVGQLDTELLDQELLEFLKGQLWGGLKYFSPSVKESYEPELLLLLRAALFKLTIWDHNASYGAALQNLRYTDARHTGPVDRPPSSTQKSLYGLVAVGGRYLHQRLNLFLLSRSSPEDATPFTTKLSRLLDVLGSIHSVLTLVSFTAFLVTGHYRTLLDRALRMRLVPPSRSVARDVSFEYLNRQLVWHAFTEFLLFILPLLRVGRWRRWWARLLRKLRSEGSGRGGNGETAGELGFLPERTCAICYRETDAEGTGGGLGGLGGGRATDITNPYEAVECGHVYCYVCLAGKIELEEGEGWPCLRCGGLVKRCRPWRGGAEGLTGVGDWGQEIYGGRRGGGGGGLGGVLGGGSGGGGGTGAGHDDDDGLSLESLASLSSSSPSSSAGPPSNLLDELQDGDVESELSELGDDDDDDDDDNDGRHRYSDHDDDDDDGPDYQVERRPGHGERRRRRGREEEDGPVTDAEAESSDAGSEVTVQPKPNGHSAEQWAALDYADDHVFDDSQYNTAEDYD